MKEPIKDKCGIFGLSCKTNKYPVWGILFGFMFPIISWTIDFIYKDLSFSLKSIAFMHSTNPLHYVIDLAPVILGGVAYLLALQIQKDQNKLEKIIAERQIYEEKVSNFANKIGLGDYDSNLDMSIKEDNLIKSLYKMRNDLKQNKKQEEINKWIIKGKDIISTTLRKYQNIDELSYNVLIDILNYTNLIQGSVYIYNDKNKKLINVASYAYDRRKYINQEFKIGQGLIGQAAYEKATVYRKEIPEYYVTITSGILGEKKPGSILIVPLISDEKLQGVIEFSSINDEISEQIIKFIEGLSEVIGQTVFNLLINSKTQLLLEDSQKMTQELQENEEELRQNAEEMRATQEELEKTNADLKGKMQEVEDAQKRMHALLENASEVISIYDEAGIIKYESPSIKTILGYDPKKLIGKNGFERIAGKENKLKLLFDELIINPDKSLDVEFEYKKADGSIVWLEATGQNLLKNPAINGVIFNIRDITIRRLAETEQRKSGRMQSLSENSPDIILRFSIDYKLYYANPMFEKFTGVDFKKHQNIALKDIDFNIELKKYIKSIINTTKTKNVKSEEEFAFTTEKGLIYTRVNLIPEYNENKELETILIVAHDITIQKQIENEIKLTNKKITDSINYAKRIQKAILPDTNYIRQYIPKSFIYYKPKDIVSGDFPWFFKRNGFIYIAAVDCTGHGVPGALLSFIGYFLLNNVVDHKEEKSAGKILDEFHIRVRKALKQDELGAQARDGMDIAFCKIDTKTNVLEYSGAHRPLYLLRDGELQQFKGDRKAIGGIPYKKKLEKNFTNYKIDIKTNDKIFIFSDGLPDQINENKEKYKSSRIREIIKQNKSISEYNNIFAKDFNYWKGEVKQVDDVLLIGLEF